MNNPEYSIAYLRNCRNNSILTIITLARKYVCPKSISAHPRPNPNSKPNTNLNSNSNPNSNPITLILKHNNIFGLTE